MNTLCSGHQFVFLLKFLFLTYLLRTKRLRYETYVNVLAHVCVYIQVDTVRTYVHINTYKHLSLLWKWCSHWIGHFTGIVSWDRRQKWHFFQGASPWGGAREVRGRIACGHYPYRELGRDCCLDHACIQPPKVENGMNPLPWAGSASIK